MLEKVDIHNYDVRLERYIDKIKNEYDLSKRNQEIILDFKDHLFLRGLSVARVLKYIETLSLIARKIRKDFDKLTKKDIESFVAQLNQRKCSPWTKQIYRIGIKKILTFLNDGKEPESIKWIKVHFSNSEKKLPNANELITEDEVMKAMNSCEDVRDRCLISVLYESGCRIGEIASLKVGTVNFDDFGVVLSVIGKTGTRKIRLVKSTALLRMLIETHPFKDNLNSFLWINKGTTNKFKPMQYGAFAKVLKTAFKRAGIKKRCNPHMFRHSRATFMANHLTEFQMNQYFGWIQGSDMPSTYVHLSGRDVDDAILRMNHLTKEEPKPMNIAVKCGRCNFINPQNTKYCLQCSQILDEKVAVEHDQKVERQKLISKLLDELIKEPNIQNSVLERIKELGLSKELVNIV